MQKHYTLTTQTHSNIKSIRYNRWFSSSSYRLKSSLSSSILQLRSISTFERSNTASKSSSNLRSSRKNSTISLDLCFNIVRYCRSVFALKKKNSYCDVRKYLTLKLYKLSYIACNVIHCYICYVCM